MQILRQQLPPSMTLWGKKSTAIPIQAKPLMKKRRKSDQRGGFCKRTRKTFLIHHQKFSRGAEGPSVCVPASRSSNFEWQATETWVLAAVLHIYGDSASSFVSLKARIFVCECVSVCSPLSTHGPSKTRRRTSKTIDFLVTQVRISEDSTHTY